MLLSAYIRPIDSLSLNDMFTFFPKKGKLCDQHINATHLISAKGISILAALQVGIRPEALIGQCKKQGISEIELRHLIEALNSCGALRCSRKIFFRLHRATATPAVFTPPYLWRRTASAWTIMKATLRVCSALTVTTLAIGTLLWPLLSNISPVRALANLSMGSFVIIASIFVHEYAHLFLIRLRGFRASVVQHGLRVGLLHKRMGTRAEIICAIIGSIAGITFSLLMALLEALPTYLAVIASILHACSLLPWCSDGKSLRTAFIDLRKDVCEKTNS